MAKEVLTGRTAIVTGGGAGIGSVICEELSAEGAAIAIWDRDGAAATARAESLPNARAYEVDIADSAAVDVATEAVLGDLGSVEILVNNAGISRVGDHTQVLSDEIWNESIAVMQTGVFFCSRAVGRHMIAAHV